MVGGARIFIGQAGASAIEGRPVRCSGVSCGGDMAYVPRAARTLMVS